MLTATANISLPAQMIPLKDKIKKDRQWAKDCMDSLETIGRQQFLENLRLVENYEMVRGKFIYSHYIDSEDYSDMISQLTREFDLPSHLRHYDIISQVINTMSGEYQKRPDLFRAKAYDEYAQNNYLRTKTDMLQQWVTEELDSYINLKLAQEGLDPNFQDFDSPEQMQQYQEELESRRQALTPPAIQKYMDTKWMDAAEQWAQHLIEFDKQRFNLPELEKIEFEDMLIADRCFRHFFLTANGYSQENWNTINTFFHKSTEVRYVENGDYVGRIRPQTRNEIINRYGWKMTEKQILQLEKFKKENLNTPSGWQSEWTGLPPNTLMPHANYPEQKLVTNQLGFDPNNPRTVDQQILEVLGEGDSVLNYNTNDLFLVTEAYWMSYRKMGKYTFRDVESGEPDWIIVDETFDLPGVEEIETSFQEFSLGPDRPGTVVWTWVPWVWTGIKINDQYSNLAEPIYLDLKPADFQFKGEDNIYGAKLPVCGQIFHNRNARSSSLVDLMKPHQIGHNVSMNQLYEIMQREVGRFWLMDFNMVPSGKDWGGERNYEKLMMVARQLGIAPIDASPSNVKQSQFAHFQVIDLDESARMISRANLATFFENQALKQVGITPQRLGSISASESATGVENAVSQSYAQTESYFTDFSNYKRRCLTMNLEIAQYVESKDDEIIKSYIRSDMSRAFIKIAGTDLLLAEFGVLVVASQELLRQLETLRQLFLENNTTGANPVDLATVVTSNSPSEIKNQLETSWRLEQERRAQEQASAERMNQANIEAQAQQAELARQWEADQKELDRANDRFIAQVKASGFAENNDINNNQIPDPLEVQRFNAELGQNSQDILFKERQESNKVLEAQRKNQIETQKLDLQKKQIESQEKQANQKDKLERDKMKNDLKIARTNKN